MAGDFLNSSTGFLLGLLGGLLDLASASVILVGGMTGAPMAGPVMNVPFVWASGLVLLGVAVISTTVISATSLMTKTSRIFPFLMILYGAIMLAVGLSMASGWLPFVMTPFYGYAMVAVGALMIVNGSMTRKPPT